MDENFFERQRLLGVYANMLMRCYDATNTSYKNYGGRGIYIVDEWLTSFEIFSLWSIENGSARGLEIDRIDNDGPYGPDNCRWVTRTENARNKRNTRYITAWDETKSLQHWAEDTRCVVDQRTLNHRIKLLGWEPEKAITQPSTRGANSCVHGHEYTDKNTYIRKNGLKMCKTCHAIRQTERYRSMVNKKKYDAAGLE